MWTQKNTSEDLLFSTKEVSEIEIVLYHGVLAVIITCGVVGNILVITVVKRTHSMHTTTNFLLVNLACSDLIILLWRIPFFFIHSLRNPSKKVNVFACKFMFIVTATMAVVCVLTLTLLSIERYHALLKPMQIRRRLTKSSSLYAVAAVWGFSITIVVPIFNNSTYLADKDRCSLEWNKNNLLITIIVFGVVVIVFPFCEMCFCYFRIIYGMYCAKNVCKGTGLASEEDERSRRKISCGLLTVTLMFAVCFIPFGVCSVLYQLEIVGIRAYALVALLFYGSSCLNPINYACQSSNYRQAFKHWLHPPSETTETVVWWKTYTQNYPSFENMQRDSRRFAFRTQKTKSPIFRIYLPQKYPSLFLHRSYLTYLLTRWKA